MEYVRCVFVWVGADERIWFGLYQSRGNRVGVRSVSVSGLRRCGWCSGELIGSLDQGLEGLGGVHTGQGKVGEKNNFSMSGKSQ